MANTRKDALAELERRIRADVKKYRKLRKQARDSAEDEDEPADPLDKLFGADEDDED